MLRETLENGVQFTRRNPAILYSLFLIIAIAGTLFFNSYYSLRKFQETSDALLKSKAILAENTFRVFGSDVLSDPETLQGKIDQVRTENDDVTAIAIYVRETEDGPFTVFASTDRASVGETIDESMLPFLIAWQDARITPTFLSHNDGQRSWNVIKKMTGSYGQRSALILFQLSLLEHDRFVEQTIRQVYGVAIVSLLGVLLLLGNHMRFFRYAVRVTKLEEVDRMKDDFISMASHELRTPLTVLRGYIDLTRDTLSKTGNGTSGASETGEYLERMEHSVTRLNELVEDILNVSRLEQNRLPITLQAVDLAPVLGDMAKEFSLLAGNKGLVFEYDPKMAFTVSADPERLKQVLVNLIGNAVKYTPKGKVALSVREDGKDIVITVADTGLGISPEAMKSLFSKFYRVQTEKTQQISGSGLGLWISREIARKMDGDIVAESIEGVGSHFSLRLRKHISEKK